MPELIGIYHDHSQNRDQFEIVAVHDSSVKSFAELHAEISEFEAEYWQGTPLPFPIVLDRDGATEKLFGIAAHPTGILIDPEGNVVGEVDPAFFESMLPPIKPIKIWLRRRDSVNNYGWSLEPQKYTLRTFAALISRTARVPIELDDTRLSEMGIDADESLAGALWGSGISFRSLEELFLARLGLGVASNPDNDRLWITPVKNGVERPSYVQEFRNRNLTKRLSTRPEFREDAPRQSVEETSSNKAETADEQIVHPITAQAQQREFKPIELKDVTLADAMKRISHELQLPLALDARTMREHPGIERTKVRGSIREDDLQGSLDQLLEPLGLRVVVVNEVVLIVANSQIR